MATAGATESGRVSGAWGWVKSFWTHDEGPSATVIKQKAKTYKSSVDDTKELYRKATEEMNLSKEELEKVIETVEESAPQVYALNRELAKVNYKVSSSELSGNSGKNLVRLFKVLTAVSTLATAILGFAESFYGSSDYIAIAVSGCVAADLGIITSYIWYRYSLVKEKEDALTDFNAAEKQSLKDLLVALKKWQEGLEAENEMKKNQLIKQSLRRMASVESGLRDRVVCRLITDTLPPEHTLHKSLAADFERPSITASPASPVQMRLVKKNNSQGVSTAFTEPSLIKTESLKKFEFDDENVTVTIDNGEDEEEMVDTMTYEGGKDDSPESSGEMNAHGSNDLAKFLPFEIKTLYYKDYAPKNVEKPKNSLLDTLIKEPSLVESEFRRQMSERDMV